MKDVSYRRWWWVHLTVYHDLCSVGSKDTCITEFDLFQAAPWLSCLQVNTKTNSPWACCFGKSCNAWDFRVLACEGHQVTCCRQRWMQDSSTWLLFCHRFPGSLHQPSSPPTQHHSSQAVWQMAGVLTPLELDKRESPDVRSESNREKTVGVLLLCTITVYTGICDRMTACHLLD